MLPVRADKSRRPHAGRSPSPGDLARCCALLAAIGSLIGCQSLTLPQVTAPGSSVADRTVRGPAFEQFIAEASRSPSRERRELVQQVGDRLAAAAERPRYSWRFELLDDPYPRVVAFPGGEFAVTEGLLAACDNEAQFAALLAREVAHLLTGRDPARWRHALRESATGGPEAAALDPQAERQADSIGLFLVARAGYDPDAVLAFWNHPDANAERAAYIARYRGERPNPPVLRDAVRRAGRVYAAGRVHRGEGIQFARRREAAPESSGASTSGWTAADDRRSTGAAGDRRGVAAEATWLPPVDRPSAAPHNEWRAVH